MLAICSIPRYSIRLKMLIFKAEFSDKYHSVMQKTDLILSINDTLRSN